MLARTPHSLLLRRRPSRRGLGRAFSLNPQSGRREPQSAGTLPVSRLLTPSLGSILLPLTLLLLTLGGGLRLPAQEAPPTDVDDRPETALPSEHEAEPPSGEGSDNDFVRFRDLGTTPEGRRGRLETAVASFERDDGARVDLIGAVHIGDPGYYEALERRFATYDKLLYELIKPEGVEFAPGEGGGGLVSGLQNGLKNVLELEFQLDGIDYRRSNFVHADVSPDEFLRLQRERGESFFTLFLRLTRAELARQRGGGNPFTGLSLLLAFASPDRASALRWSLAGQLEDMERLMAGLEDGGHESVIVVARNKVALRRLREVLGSGHKRIGIFYGAAHMPDMAARLVEELGFRRGPVNWLTAWDIHKKVRRARKPREETNPASDSDSSGSPAQPAPPGPEDAPPRKSCP